MLEELNSEILQKEYEQTASIVPELNILDGKYVLITGATGLIGTQIAKTLLCFNRLYNKNIHVITCGRNRDKIMNIYGHLTHLENLHIIQADVREPVETELPVDYIIHCASITSSQAFVKQPVDTIQTLIQGTENILNLAIKKQCDGFIYLSSLEVYGVPTVYHVKESDYGFIDFLNVRSSYSEGKRMAECICEAYYSQYQVPVKIARLTQTIGAGIEYSDNRVFAQFARSVIEKEDIVLNTPGKTVRSYCDICDAVSAIFTILLKGENGEAYNVANMSTAISIAELAQLVCEQNPDSGIKVIFNTPENVGALGYNPEMRISMDTGKLQKLGWQPTVGLESMFRKLIVGLNEKKKLPL